MTRIPAAIAACYQWSSHHPEAIPYGMVLIAAAQFRAGDGLMILVGAAAIAGGVRSIFRKSNPE
jgi:hypothetical protein